MSAEALQVKREVIVIPADPKIDLYTGATKTEKIPVCAYARVSTDDEDQKNSYEAQKEYYEEKIKANPEWEYVKVFADEGLSGTSLKKRDEFNKMIRMARRGRIKLILVKSISRWARNTLDSISLIRELKARGVAVYFEAQGVNTLEETSEFIITLFSGFAQAESESISTNVAWGMRKKMAAGKAIFQYKKLYGYRKNEKSQPEIVLEEAPVVLRIYKEYLAGYSYERIMEGLNDDGIVAPYEADKWSRQVIRNILTNEIYMGDIIRQKTYKTGPIEGKTLVNNGALPKYHIVNNHEGIIPRGMFAWAQEEMARRNSLRTVDQNTGRTKQGKFSSKYALSGKMFCGECEAPYMRRTWSKDGRKKIVWRCGNRLNNGTKFCKDSPSIEESALHKAIVYAVNELLENRKEIEITMRDAAVTAVCGEVAEHDVIELRRQQNALQKAMGEMVNELGHNVDGKEPLTIDRFRELTQEMQAELSAIDTKLCDHDRNMAVLQYNNERVQRIYQAIEEIGYDQRNYQDRLVAQIIERVNVNSAEQITVRFVNGTTVQAQM